jgi:hypothetical protein
MATASKHHPENLGFNMKATSLAHTEAVFQTRADRALPMPK